MEPRELTDKVIFASRAEWDAFLDRASNHGAVKLHLVVDPALTTRVDQASYVFTALPPLPVQHTSSCPALPFFALLSPILLHHHRSRALFLLEIFQESFRLLLLVSVAVWLLHCLRP